MLLLEEAGKGAQEAAEQSAGGLPGGIGAATEDGETIQQHRRRAAAPPAESESRQTERRTRNRSEARQEHGGQGRRFALLEKAGKGAQEAAELGAADCAGGE